MSKFGLAGFQDAPRRTNLHRTKTALPVWDQHLVRADVLNKHATLRSRRKRRLSKARSTGADARPKDPVVHFSLQVGVLKAEEFLRVVDAFEVAEDAGGFPDVNGRGVRTVVDQGGHLGCLEGVFKAQTSVSPCLL